MVRMEWFKACKQHVNPKPLGLLPGTLCGPNHRAVARASAEPSICTAEHYQCGRAFHSPATSLYLLPSSQYIPHYIGYLIGNIQYSGWGV